MTNRVFSSFNHFTAFDNFISFNSKSIISLRVQCTSITNGVLSSYDRFTAYYNCMSYNFRNLISPRVQCTKTTNRVISSFDRFTDYYNRKWGKTSKSLICPMSSVHKYHKSCSAQWPFYLLQLYEVWRPSTNQYEVKLQKSHISVSSVHKYQKWCSKLIWPIRGLLQL